MVSESPKTGEKERDQQKNEPQKSGSPSDRNDEKPAKLSGSLIILSAGLFQKKIRLTKNCETDQLFTAS